MAELNTIAILQPAHLVLRPMERPQARSQNGAQNQSTNQRKAKSVKVVARCQHFDQDCRMDICCICKRSCLKPISTVLGLSLRSYTATQSGFWFAPVAVRTSSTVITFIDFLSARSTAYFSNLGVQP